MSIRFDIDQNYWSDIGQWMTERFGPPMEDVTWFWSGRLVQKIDNYGNKVSFPIEGIRIYKDCANTSLALIKWGYNVS